MEKKNYKDNLNENGIEDYMAEGCNISKTLRDNRDKMFEAKEQRNSEAKKVEIYKNAFGITLVILFMIIILGISSYALKNESNKKGLNYCQAQGYSYEYCQKGL